MPLGKKFIAVQIIATSRELEKENTQSMHRLVDAELDNAFPRYAASTNV